MSDDESVTILSTASAKARVLADVMQRHCAQLRSWKPADPALATRGESAAAAVLEASIRLEDALNQSIEKRT
ncbi:MAG: hypothetical protein ACREJC_10150 [Tepidisphaeraceae bacterium]